MPAATTTVDGALHALKSALQNSKPPYCSGTLELDEKYLDLFYGNTRDNARRVNMNKATIPELKHLTRTCEPATFGLNQEDVLDLSYRRAGKLDESCIATKLDLDEVGLMEVIQYGLLEGKQGTREFCAELYKLNVYGKGSFFKAHKDTPRGEDMFGSLVVIFPTKHTGGSLILRHDDEEWSFDSGTEIAKKKEESPPACIAYAAFFSDVEHEVSTVTSGYRVTLTYNLYFKQDAHANPEFSWPPWAKDRETMPSVSDTEAFKEALSDLLDDPSFLPEGGTIGFGLFHQYPIFKDRKDMRNLRGILKGRDAMVLQSCLRLRLDATFWRLYKDDDDGSWILSRDVVEPCYIGEGWESITTFLIENGCTLRIVKQPDGYEIKKAQVPFCDVLWVNDVTDLNTSKSVFATYGNEPGVGYAYANVCLIVDVGPPEDRSLKGMDCDSESM